jgi:hypothetical protein
MLGYGTIKWIGRTKDFEQRKTCKPESTLPHAFNADKYCTDIGGVTKCPILLHYQHPSSHVLLLSQERGRESCRLPLHYPPLC